MCDEAVEKLSQRLHWKMECLDPSEDRNWAALSDYDKDFYRQCIRAILQEPTVIAKALGCVLRPHNESASLRN